MADVAASRGIPSARRLGVLVSGVLFLAALGAFAYAATTVDHFPGEISSSSWVQSWRTSWLDAVMKALSALGTELIAAAAVTLAALALYLKTLRQEAGIIVGATVVGYGLRTALKLAIGRPRPSSDLVQVIEQSDGYSFPSGHVMHYVVFLGTLAFILSANMKPGLARWLVQGAVVLLLLLMGLSRIYLGVHWLGDVVAGYAFGAVVVAAALWVRRRWASDNGGSTLP